MNEHKPRVFLCHAHEDKPRVRELYHQLKDAGYHPWLDEEDLLPGQTWRTAIRRIIRDTNNLVVVCLSNHSITKRGTVQREIKWALDVLEEMPEGAIYLIPARLEDCRPPEQLSHLHRVDLFEPDGFEKLTRSLDSELGQAPIEPEMILPPAKGVSVPIPEEIVEEVIGGRCVLFLGPLASALSPQGSRYEYSQAPPSSTELSRRLAAMCAYPYEDVTNLQRVSLFFQNRPSGSRKSLVQAINEEMIGPEILPSPLLHMLAALPLTFVITTSYDNLFDIALSRAYARDGRPKQPIVRIYDPTPTGPTERVPLDPTEERPILLKLFGDISRPESIVVTEEDYMVFQQRMTDRLDPPIHIHIRARLEAWPAIWIGYTLADYSLRLLVRALRAGVDVANVPKGVLVEPSPDSHLVPLWQDRVSFFRENLWDFVPSLYEQVIGVEYQPDSLRDEPG